MVEESRDDTTYDTAGRLQGISTASGAFSYSYRTDHRSRVEKIALPSGNWITNDYDDLARVTRTHLTAANGYLTNKKEATGVSVFRVL